MGEVGGISLKTKTEMRPRLGADFRKRLEATNAAVKETGGLRIQFATQFTEAFQRQHLFGIDMQTMRFQQRGQRVGIRGSKPVCTL